jgi:hypothetical protein
MAVFDLFPDRAYSELEDNYRIIGRVRYYWRKLSFGHSFDYSVMDVVYSSKEQSGYKRFYSNKFTEYDRSIDLDNQRIAFIEGLNKQNKGAIKSFCKRTTNI